MNNIWKTNTAYYFSIITPIIVSGLLFFYIFQDTGIKPDHSIANSVLFLFKLFWLTGIVVALTNIIGLVWFGNPENKNKISEILFKKTGWLKDNFLIIVYVSRGDNVKALERAVSATEIVLNKYDVKYRIDIVTDMPVHESIVNDAGNKFFHVVPEGYNTLKGAKWKARALHYVVEQHNGDSRFFNDKSFNTWILHLDEESIVTSSVIAGISEFISNKSNANCIGQGEIKYNSHNYGEHLIITWADCIRSGDDLGRFRLQYTLFEKPFFGMHGSYILTPLHIEQRFGFDLGGKGSITEDAYFALKCSEAGIVFKWVNGYIREQSPFSIMALAKQRRRWFCGLFMLSFDKHINLKTRLPLMINTLLWSVAWIGPTVTVLTLLLGGYFPLALLAIAALLQGFYASVYMVGAMRNLADVKDQISPMRKVAIYAGSVIGVHIASLLEGFSILYAIFSPVKTFDVIEKN